jgi:hypothetical protein
MRGAVLSLASLAAFAACAQVLDLDGYGEGGATTGVRGGDGGGGTASDGAGGAVASATASGVGGAGGGGGSPACDVRVADLVADTAIAMSGGCPGTITYGGDTFANIGIGRMLLRFDVTELLPMLEAGLVTSLQLRLSADPDYGPLNASGSLLVHPLSNDWLEGASQSADGADWCRRTAVNSELWDQPGASGSGDIGTLAGAEVIDPKASAITIDLEYTGLLSWRDGNVLSLRVATQPGTYVVGTNENGVTAAPTLTLTYCP